MTKKPKTKLHPEIIQAKKELATLRRLRTLGYALPYGRINELERFVETNGRSHGWNIK